MRTLQDLYQEYVVDLDGILWEMGRVNGVHVDNEARLQLLSEMDSIVRTVQDESQGYVPESLFPLHHLKSEPTEEQLQRHRARGVRTIEVPNDAIKTCANCGAQHVTKTEHTGRKGGQKGTPFNPCYKADIVLRAGINTEYDIVLPFNPGSDDQLKAYAEHFKHKLGRNWKTGEDTLDAKQVQKFINRYGEKHPIYQAALKIRKVKKARGYAKGWVPDEKGLLYGHFKHVPETLRLSQADHNFMNVSHRGDAPYAKELRRLLIAPEGYTLVEADSSSIEAVFSGKLMGSTEYMELAKRGIHAWWALKKLGMEATKENIAWMKNSEEHQVLYETKKRTVHGVSYGMGAKLLHESYPELFPTKDAAQAEINEFYELVPMLKDWHTDTQKWAHKHGYLQSPWGFRNYYYRVFQYDWKTKLWKPGPDAKAAIAFQPQHANAMFQRENLKLIHATIKKMGKAETWKMTAIGYVHDSIGLRVPDEDVEKAADLLIEVMNRPVKQMDNIQIGVGTKFGKNWGEMKPLKSI